MEEVNFWALKMAAKQAVDDCLDWHVSGPPGLEPNRIMDHPIDGVFQRIGIVVIFERVGEVVINQAAIGKLPSEFLRETPKKRFFRWPLR